MSQAQNQQIQGEGYGGETASAASIKSMNQVQLREYFNRFKPLSLEDALKQAQERRAKFEKINKEYIE